MTYPWDSSISSSSRHLSVIFLLLSWSRRAKAAESADSAAAGDDAAAVSTTAVLPPFAEATALFSGNIVAAAIATEGKVANSLCLN